MPAPTPEQVNHSIEFNVFVQRVDRVGGADKGGQTFWQVVDRLVPKGSVKPGTSVVADFDSEAEADAKCVELRDSHIADVVRLLS